MSCKYLVHIYQALSTYTSVSILYCSEHESNDQIIQKIQNVTVHWKPEFKLCHVFEKGLGAHYTAYTEQ